MFYNRVYRVFLPKNASIFTSGLWKSYFSLSGLWSSYLYFWPLKLLSLLQASEAPIFTSDLWSSYLSRSGLWSSYLSRSGLWSSYLSRSGLWSSYLSRSGLWSSYLYFWPLKLLSFTFRPLKLPSLLLASESHISNFPASEAPIFTSGLWSSYLYFWFEAPIFHVPASTYLYFWHLKVIFFTFRPLKLFNTGLRSSNISLSGLWSSYISSLLASTAPIFTSGLSVPFPYLYSVKFLSSLPAFEVSISGRTNLGP